MNRFTVALIVALALLLFGVADYHEQNTKLKRDVAEISSLARQQQSTIETMTAQREQAAQLDKKYAQELADAKNENDKLRSDIESGTKRLRVNATCKSVSGTAKSSSLDDAAATELTPDARQNYFSLREQLTISEKQIRGLQDYIRKVVFNEKGESNQ